MYTNQPVSNRLLESVQKKTSLFHEIRTKN